MRKKHTFGGKTCICRGIWYTVQNRTDRRRTTWQRKLPVTSAPNVAAKAASRISFRPREAMWPGCSTCRTGNTTPCPAPAAAIPSCTRRWTAPQGWMCWTLSCADRRRQRKEGSHDANPEETHPNLYRRTAQACAARAVGDPRMQRHRGVWPAHQIGGIHHRPVHCPQYRRGRGAGGVSLYAPAHYHPGAADGGGHSCVCGGGRRADHRAPRDAAGCLRGDAGGLRRGDERPHQQRYSPRGGESDRSPGHYHRGERSGGFYQSGGGGSSHLQCGGRCGNPRPRTEDPRSAAGVSRDCHRRADGGKHP